MIIYCTKKCHVSGQTVIAGVQFVLLLIQKISSDSHKIKMTSLDLENKNLYIMTINNQPCRNRLTEDCWDSRKVNPLIPSRNYLFHLQSSQDRDYLKVLFSRKPADCQEKCVTECTCNCETEITDCAEEKTEIPP